MSWTALIILLLTIHLTEVKEEDQAKNLAPDIMLVMTMHDEDRSVSHVNMQK
jgi:hypothetical protein